MQSYQHADPCQQQQQHTAVAARVTASLATVRPWQFW